GIILVSPEEKVYSYAIRLKFNASNHAMDCETLLAGLAAYTNQVRTYDISYIQRKKAEGLVVKKFFVQGEQVKKTSDVNKGEMFNLNKKLQAKSTPTTRAWRLYLGKETIDEGLGVGIILVSPEEKVYSYAIRLKFNASNHAMDCETLLAGLAAYTNQGMKDLHVFIDSSTLVA
nr:hypothetical protein [Tanacetum cinerariifolium]